MEIPTGYTLTYDSKPALQWVTLYERLRILLSEAVNKCDGMPATHRTLMEIELNANTELHALIGPEWRVNAKFLSQGGGVVFELQTPQFIFGSLER
jgi:hypothetical protein